MMPNQQRHFIEATNPASLKRGSPINPKSLQEGTDAPHLVPFGPLGLARQQPVTVSTAFLPVLSCTLGVVLLLKTSLSRVAIGHIRPCLSFRENRLHECWGPCGTHSFCSVLLLSTSTAMIPQIRLLQTYLISELGREPNQKQT